jgi:hypothetical protein
MKYSYTREGTLLTGPRGSFLFVFVLALFGMLFFSQPARNDGVDRLDSALFGDWRWLGAETPVGEIDPLPDQDYLVSFGPEGSLQMKLEINRVNTAYSADGRRLTVSSPMMTTMAAWMHDSPAPKFLLLVENTSNYFFRDGILHVDTFADGGTLRFERIE